MTVTVAPGVVTDQSGSRSLHGRERHVTGPVIEPRPQLWVLGAEAVTPDKLDRSLDWPNKTSVSLDTISESYLQVTMVRERSEYSTHPPGLSYGHTLGSGSRHHQGRESKQ